LEEALVAANSTKVRIFAWKAIHGGLATKFNKHRRYLKLSAVCEICGMEEETKFHALVRCTHAATLRENMRASWLIPDERLLMFSGPEWLLQVIGASTKEEAGRLILILWRAWFVRNEWTHAGRWVGGGRVDQVSDKLLGVPGGKLLAGRRRP